MSNAQLELLAVSDDADTLTGLVVAEARRLVEHPPRAWQTIVGRLPGGI
jgi:hypothetical protein